MCGISGIYNYLDNKPVDPEAVSKMTYSLKHRGPDDEGYYIHDNIGLGFRRLSIIDLERGNQPLANEDSSLWIVFNGEIYNYRELREQLIARGHRFRTDSDTEVIVHLYEDHGFACLEFLRGMFGFALWDTKEQLLFLARDRIGKKPLLYVQGKGCLAFASELKALLKLEGISKEIDLAALDDYLSLQYIPHPATIIQGIRKLPPAHYLVCDHRGITINRYWKLDYSRKLQLSEKEYAEAILANLKEATRIRLRSDVPVGALLSGGIDSGAVVGMISQISDQPIKTFSVGFHEEKFNELPYARKIADKFLTNHTEIVLKPEVIGLLPTLAYFFDEPFADSSAIPAYYISSIAAQQVKVVLTGDGGDESFAGYPRYRKIQWFKLLQRFPQSTIKTFEQWAIELLFGLDKQAEKLNRMDKKILRALFPDLRCFHFREFFNGRIKKQLYSEFLQQELNHAHIERIKSMRQAGSANAEGMNIVDRMLALDFDWYLPDDLMYKTDIASMANSLEARCPFLDHQFLEFSAAIPPKWKVRRGTGKYILKKALESLLPHENIHRKKMGFTVPLHHWFRKELKDLSHDLLLSRNSRCRSLFQIPYIEKMLQEHLAYKSNHGRRLWALVMLEMWADTHLSVKL